MKNADLTLRFATILRPVSATTLQGALKTLNSSAIPAGSADALKRAAIVRELHRRDVTLHLNFTRSK